ncbi:MAG TPA: hypothetical protein VGG70_13440 [Candidatus Cybelea sp.]|jgi:hypothetical protein
MAANKPDNLKEEPILARLRDKPGEPPAGLTSFVGLLGHSPRPGYWLLYPNLDMSRSVEIAESDIVHAEKLSPEQSPFGSLGGTRVFVKQAAQITHSATQPRKASEAAPNEFDLDVRQGPIRPGVGGRVIGRTEQCGTPAPGLCGTPNPGTDFACTK